MYIRPSKKRIQFLRTEYCKETGGSKQTLLGSIPLGAVQAPAEITAKFTPEEQSQYDDWCAGAKASAADDKINSTKLLLSAVLRNIKEARKLTDDETKAVWQALVNIEHVLKRRKCKKPKDLVQTVETQQELPL